MRTKTNPDTDWIKWYSGKVPFVNCTYMMEAHLFTIQIGAHFRDVPVATKEQAQEMAKKIIKAFEQAYEIAQIIQPE